MGLDLRESVCAALRTRLSGRADLRHRAWRRLRVGMVETPHEQAPTILTSVRELHPALLGRERQRGPAREIDRTAPSWVQIIRYTASSRLWSEGGTLPEHACPPCSRARLAGAPALNATTEAFWCIQNGTSELLPPSLAWHAHRLLRTQRGRAHRLHLALSPGLGVGNRHRAVRIVESRRNMYGADIA